MVGRFQFEPLDYADETWTCSATVTGLRWNHLSWRGLPGSRFDEQDRGHAEASFYVCEHDWADVESREIEKGRWNGFLIHLSLIVDFNGVLEGDEDSQMLVQACIHVPFKGIYISHVSRLLWLRTKGRLLRRARAFLEIEDFSLQQADHGFFLLAPRYS